MSAINVAIKNNHLVVSFSDTSIIFGEIDDNTVMTKDHLKQVIKNIDSVNGSKIDWHIKLIYIYLKNKFDEIFEKVKDLHKQQNPSLYVKETFELCDSLFNQIFGGDDE